MRLVFFGTSAFAVPSLKRLAARHAVALCVTQPDKPKGRGLKLEPSPVKQAALSLSLPLAEPRCLTASDVSRFSADIGVVAAYGQLISREVMRHFPQGILGIHPSLLPKYRGAAPVAWTILNGESTAGLSIFRINEALDAGPVLSRRKLPISAEDTAQSLTLRLAELGSEEILRALESIEQGKAVFVEQDPAQASLAPKLSKAQGRMDWWHPAALLERQVRALFPWPGAWVKWRGRRLKILSTAVDQKPLAGKAAPPGSVIACGANEFLVATGEGVLVIKELQLPGKRPVSAKEFLAGHPVRAGDRFESGS